MCYDISYKSNLRLVAEYIKELQFDPQLELAFDGTHIMGHAYGLHPIIYQNRDDKMLHCVPMEWGCIPYYVKDLEKFKRQRATMLNARSERILQDETSYWYKIRNRRCLIPVTGFYEHREIAGWKKKVPYFIKLKGQELFFIAGLYSVAKFPDPETAEELQRWTFTLITRDANSIMKLIHNGGDNAGRMPLMLSTDMAMEWVREDLSPERMAEILAFEMPSENLDYWPVFTIRSPKGRPDEKEKNEPWEWEGLPELMD